MDLALAVGRGDSPPAVLDADAHYDATAQSFPWTATADRIIEELVRLARPISGTSH